MTRERVVIVGATGFIGAKLVPVLHGQGFPLTTIGRRGLADPPENCRHERVDISPATDWRPLLEGADTLVHLADGFNAFEGLPPATQDAAASARFEATLNLARSAIESGVRRFVYLSTIKAMCGTWTEDVLTEQSPAHPTSLYGRLKLEAEQEIADRANGSGTTVVSLRFPIVFGAGAGGNFTRLIRLADLPLPLPFAGLSHRRSMISVTSLTDAIARAVTQSEVESGTFLVHDGALSLSELITALRQGLARPPGLFHIAEGFLRPLESVPRMGRIVQRFTRPLEICDDRFRQHFAWEPPVNMTDEVVAAAQIYSRSSSVA